ncbi:ATP-binding protein [Jannaschia sp. M317]|uniref:ATP-binding protein n=1 Tax=Jannaschia sp. M317 TaxID=2867011 RepID=UPI0021A29FC1|nr:ATP-binding protein [Jannaschia sp. M317]UWQ17730.1 response regulator [Jannaschia sp. M317]
MDGSPPENLYLQERRRRLAAERTLDRTRHELSRAHRALVANADRLSLRFLSEREANHRLTDRQKDILERYRSEADKADRARRRLWHALEAMRDGFALFDGDGCMVAANSVYLNLFDAASTIGPGATAEQMFMTAAEEGAFDLGELDPDDWTSEQLARWAQTTIGIQVLQTFDGRAIRFQDRRAPDGDIVSLAIDISDVEERQASLAAARDAAEEVAAAKAAFLARMSHEMRTPMNGVLGLAELLCEQGLDEESDTYARTIRDSAEALLVIVNDTLDVSRLDAGRVDLRQDPFDLEGLLCDCLRLAAASKQAAGVDVALDYPLDAPTTFVGDAGRIRQVVMNLVGNALKFTDTGHVIVRARLARHGEEAAVTLEVQDTGPGIPPDRRDHVFEAFAQVEDGRPQKEGTGLGLTISRGLVERMGGTISLLDVPQGSCFQVFLTLPLRQEWPAPLPDLPQVTIPAGTGIQGEVLANRLQAAGGSIARNDSGAIVLRAADGPDLPLDPDARLVLYGAAQSASAELRAKAAAILPLPLAGGMLLGALTSGPAPRATARRRVLIADDNATNRFLLEKMLASEPYDLESVEDGSQAVDAYLARRPDIVLLDISMPVMDGTEAIAAIQAAEAEAGRRPVPVIALTAHTGDDMSETLLRAGFAAHQTKPVRKPALLQAMEEALAVSPE